MDQIKKWINKLKNCLRDKYDKKFNLIGIFYPKLFGTKFVNKAFYKNSNHRTRFVFNNCSVKNYITIFYNKLKILELNKFN